MGTFEMNVDKATVARMWRDRNFRAQMNAEGLRAPAHPAGEPSLSLDGKEAEWLLVTATCGNDTGFLCDLTCPGKRCS